MKKSLGESLKKAAVGNNMYIAMLTMGTALGYVLAFGSAKAAHSIVYSEKVNKIMHSFG